MKNAASLCGRGSRTLLRQLGFVLSQSSHDYQSCTRCSNRLTQASKSRYKNGSETNDETYHAQPQQLPMHGNAGKSRQIQNLGYSYSQTDDESKLFQYHVNLIMEISQQYSDSRMPESQNLGWLFFLLTDPSHPHPLRKLSRQLVFQHHHFRTGELQYLEFGSPRLPVS